MPVLVLVVAILFGLCCFQCRCDVSAISRLMPLVPIQRYIFWWCRSYFDLIWDRYCRGIELNFGAYFTGVLSKATAQQKMLYTVKLVYWKSMGPI